MNNKRSEDETSRLGGLWAGEPQTRDIVRRDSDQGLFEKTCGYGWRDLLLALSLGLAAVMLASFLIPGQVAAQDERPVIVHYLAGPYEVGVLTQRSKLAVGKALFTIHVREAQSGDPVRDAKVMVRTRHQVDGTEGWSFAFNTPKVPEAYRAQISLDAPGIWEAMVEIEGPLGTSLTSVGSLHVPNPRTYSSGSLVFVGVFIILLLGAGYLWRTTTRNARRSISISESRGFDDLPQLPDDRDW